MKKLMFAQSRFVFMAGPEGPSHVETVKQMQDMLKTPEKDLALKQGEADRLDRVARNTISQLPDEEQRPARLRLIALKNRLDQAIEKAKEAQGMGDQSEMAKLLESGKDLLAVKEAQIKIAFRQKALNDRIDQAKGFYRMLLTGNSIDGDLRLDLEDLMTNLGQVKSKVDEAPAIDSTDTQLDKWAGELSAEVGKYEVSGKASQEVFANSKRRDQIRARVSNDRDVMGTVRGNLRELAREHNGDVSAADTLLQALDAIKEPANRSGKEAWEKYGNDVQKVVTELNAGKDDFMKQVQEKQALDADIAAKLAVVNEGWSFQKGPELKKAQKKAADALKEIGSVGPKFGDTSKHDAYKLATTKAALVMTEFDGEKASQDVVKSGGRDALLVYKDLQAGKFKTVAEFQKAFKEALEKDKTVAGYSPDADVALLEEAAGKLEKIGVSKLEQQEAIAKMLADAAGKAAAGVKDFVGGLAKGLGDLADAAGQKMDEAGLAIAKARDKAAYGAAVKAVADAKARLDGQRGRAAKVALDKLNIAGTLLTPEDYYDEQNSWKPGELDSAYQGDVKAVQDIMAKYEKDAAREARLAAAKRRAAREVAKATAPGVDMVKDPKSRLYVPKEGQLPKVDDVAVDLGVKPRIVVKPISPDEAGDDDVARK